MVTIPSGGLKNICDIDKWPSTRLCLSVRGMSVTAESGSYFCSQGQSNSTGAGAEFTKKRIKIKLSQNQLKFGINSSKF